MKYMENSLTYEQYKSLRTDVGWNNFSEEQARNALSSSTYVLSVLSGNRAVGMGRLIGDGMYFIIADVIVIPEFQNKGIGTELIHKLLDYIEEKTPAGSRVSVQLIAEKGKEAFYERFGFKRIPHEYCGSGMRKVIYK